MNKKNTALPSSDLQRKEYMVGILLNGLFSLFIPVNMNLLRHILSFKPNVMGGGGYLGHATQNVAKSASVRTIITLI